MADQQTLVPIEEKKDKVSSEDILEMLKRRYKDEFFVPEFRDRPSNYSHRIDAFLIYLHPSRSKELECFEIKTLRSDWIKELNSPDKADGIGKHCDRIWLVTSEESVARIDEIPTNWGWMSLKGKRLKVIKQAPKLEPMFDRDFLITVAQCSRSLYNNFNSDRYLEGFNAGAKSANERDDSWDRKQYEQLQKDVKNLEEVTGLEIQWRQEKDVKEIVELAKSIKRMRENYSLELLQGNINSVQRAIDDLKEKLEILKEKSKLEEPK